MERLIAAFLFFFILLTYSSAQAEPTTISVATGSGKHDVDLYFPDRFQFTKTYPVVIALHGDVGTNKQMRGMTLFDDLGRSEKFITAYPQADKVIWDPVRCCGTLQEGTDDVRFISTLIDLLVKSYRVDPSRVYLAGYDTGARLAYRYICDAPDRVAAVATVGGEDWYTNCKRPQRPVPILALHGTADTCVPYDGKGMCGRCIERYCDNHPTLSISDGKKISYSGTCEPSNQNLGTCCKTRFQNTGSLNSLMLRNQCDPVEDKLLTIRASYECGEGNEMTSIGDVQCTKWPSCRHGSSVNLCKIEGAGHTWPGAMQFGYNDCLRAGFKKDCEKIMNYLGPVNMDINATSVIWQFFKENPKP